MAGRRWSAWSIAAAGAVALTSTAGCYNHVPISASTSVVGQDVQVKLTAVGTETMTAQVGPYVGEVDGRLLGFDQTSMTVAVASTVNTDGLSQNWKGEAVKIPQHMVAQMTVRTLSRQRTALAILASLAGVVALRGALGGTSFVGGGHPTGGLPTGK